MLNIPGMIPVRTRLPLAAWAVAAVVALVSLMSSLWQAHHPIDHAHAERRAADPAENRGARRKSEVGGVLAAFRAAPRRDAPASPRQDRTRMPNI